MYNIWGREKWRFPIRMSSHRSLLWLTLKLTLIIQCLSRNVYVFNFIYAVRCFRVLHKTFSRWRPQRYMTLNWGIVLYCSVLFCVTSPFAVIHYIALCCTHVYYVTLYILRPVTLWCDFFVLCYVMMLHVTSFCVTLRNCVVLFPLFNIFIYVTILRYFCSTMSVSIYWFLLDWVLLLPDNELDVFIERWSFWDWN
jgi:hypothetical protein